MRTLRILFLLIPFLILSGCREDVIDPLNAATNVNEPVQTMTHNSYSFIINAVDINKDVENSTSLYTTRNRVLITNDGYKSGKVDIIIYDEDGNNIFEASVSSNEKGLYASITGFVPHKIQLSFSDFTARFTIGISPLY